MYSHFLTVKSYLREMCLLTTYIFKPLIFVFTVFHSQFSSFVEVVLYKVAVNTELPNVGVLHPGEIMYLCLHISGARAGITNSIPLAPEQELLVLHCPLVISVWKLKQEGKVLLCLTSQLGTYLGWLKCFATLHISAMSLKALWALILVLQINCM